MKFKMSKCGNHLIFKDESNGVLRRLPLKKIRKSLIDDLAAFIVFTQYYNIYRFVGVPQNVMSDIKKDIRFHKVFPESLVDKIAESEMIEVFNHSMFFTYCFVIWESKHQKILVDKIKKAFKNHLEKNDISVDVHNGKIRILEGGIERFLVADFIEEIKNKRNYLAHQEKLYVIKGSESLDIHLNPHFSPDFEYNYTSLCEGVKNLNFKLDKPSRSKRYKNVKISLEASVGESLDSYLLDRLIVLSVIYRLLMAKSQSMEESFRNLPPLGPKVEEIKIVIGDCYTKLERYKFENSWDLNEKHIWVGYNCLVSYFKQWEFIRKCVADSSRIDASNITESQMGDLRIIRNVITHNNGFTSDPDVIEMIRKMKLNYIEGRIIVPNDYRFDFYKSFKLIINRDMDNVDI